MLEDNLLNHLLEMVGTLNAQVNETWLIQQCIGFYQKALGVAYRPFFVMRHIKDLAKLMSVFKPK